MTIIQIMYFIVYNTYNVHAISKGFGVRKKQKFWHRNELVRCIFLCSCKGKSYVLAFHEERKRQSLEYQCDLNKI